MQRNLTFESYEEIFKQEGIEPHLTDYMCGTNLSGTTVSVLDLRSFSPRTKKQTDYQNITFADELDHRFWFCFRRKNGKIECMFSCQKCKKIEVVLDVVGFLETPDDFKHVQTEQTFISSHYDYEQGTVTTNYNLSSVRDTMIYRIVSSIQEGSRV